MADKDADVSSKTPKSCSAQEHASSNGHATTFPNWASFQSYYSTVGASPIPPPGFFHLPVATGPQGHPWGAQRMISQYPYITMYPHGGIYPHPSVTLGSHSHSPFAMTSLIVTAEASVSPSVGVEHDGKTNENGKTSGASANDDVSESGGSGSEGSSEGSDAHSADVSEQKKCHRHGSTNVPPAVIPAPTTTLNMGTDCWGGSASLVTSSRRKLPVKPAKAPGSLSRDGALSDLWLQDEREIKRQRRKQSNRESARRSRLRKQAECEELAKRVGVLKDENDSLAEELRRIREDCNKLASENASLNGAVRKLKGKEQRVDERSVQLESNSELTEEMKVVVDGKVKVEAADARKSGKCFG